jgi:hypothetical protein
VRNSFTLWFTNIPISANCHADVPTAIRTIAAVIAAVELAGRDRQALTDDCPCRSPFCDATNLEHVQDARHSGPVATQPGERATIHAVVGVVGIPDIDDEQIGVDKDYRRPRLSSSAFFHDGKRGFDRLNCASMSAHTSL